MCRLAGDSAFALCTAGLACPSRKAQRRRGGLPPFPGAHLTIPGGSGSGRWWRGSRRRGCSRSARHSSARTCRPAWETAVRTGNPTMGEKGPQSAISGTAPPSSPGHLSAPCTIITSSQLSSFPKPRLPEVSVLKSLSLS